MQLILPFIPLSVQAGLVQIVSVALLLLFLKKMVAV